MPKCPLRRSEWRRTKSGTWTCSLGERGARVRLFEKRKDGGFYREVHVPGQGRDRRALGTRDRAEAERLGRQLLARLLTGERVAAEERAGPVLLGELWRRYSTDGPMHLDNKPSSRADAVSRCAVLLGHFGEKCDVRMLSASDVALYATARRVGGIRCAGDRVTGPVRQRSAQADLVLLRTMLRWACTQRLPSGAPWLDRNPLEGVRFEREKNPVRPVASWERFTATRAALHQLQGGAADNAARHRWLRLELALVLAKATGRRWGAIVGLRWEDIDATSGTIRWRAEFDKKGQEWRVPAPAELLAEPRSFQ